MNILVVDDKPDNAELLVQLLEDDYEVITAKDGVECLRKANQTIPDLIILDVKMPTMDGYEVLEELQTSDVTKNIPVILLSARYRDSDRVAKGLELGAIDYLTKPIEEDELFARIRVALRIKSAEDQVQKKMNELRSLNDELSSYLYSVSHDLNTPLRRINSFVQVLNEDYENQFSDDAKKIFNRIQSANDEIKSRLKSYLTLSRITDATFIPTKIKLSDLIDQVTLYLKESYANFSVENKIPQTLVVKGEKHLIELIVKNIIENILKNNTDDSFKNIVFGHKNSSGEIVFFVSDNDATVCSLINTQDYSPFRHVYTGDAISKSNIDLAMVQRAIHRHGGRIWAEVNPKKCCSFYFTLPISNGSDNHILQKTVHDDHMA